LIDPAKCWYSLFSHPWNLDIDDAGWMWEKEANEKKGRSMRLQSKKQLTIRGKVLGGPTPLVCIPLVANDTPSLIEQAEQVLPFQPDILEWRVDKFDAVRKIDAVLDALRVLRKTIGNLPLIVTCRTIDEGGFQEISEDDRLVLIKKTVETNLVDLIDTEISNGDAMVGEVREICRAAASKLILSYHNFKETPQEEVIIERLQKAQALGADVAKVTVMPNSYKDVLTLLSATYTARTELMDIPIIAISMGPEGAITRIAGGLFGSDLTFAIGKASSAPGQIPIEDVRKAWSVLPFN
jgi:3-dehydroquinate dehydratase-1